MLLSLSTSTTLFAQTLSTKNMLPTPLCSYPPLSSQPEASRRRRKSKKEMLTDFS